MMPKLALKYMYSFLDVCPAVFQKWFQLSLAGDHVSEIQVASCISPAVSLLSTMTP